MESKVVGTWKPVVEPTAEMQKNPQMALGLAALQNMTLEITADHKFSGMTLEGDWKIEDGVLHLQTKKVAGMDAAAFAQRTGTNVPDNMDMQLKLSDDGKTLTPTAPRPGAPPMKFVKQ